VQGEDYFHRLSSKYIVERVYGEMHTSTKGDYQREKLLRQTRFKFCQKVIVPVEQDILVVL